MREVAVGAHKQRKILFFIFNDLLGQTGVPCAGKLAELLVMTKPKRWARIGRLNFGRADLRQNGPVCSTEVRKAFKPAEIPLDKPYPSDQY